METKASVRKLRNVMRNAGLALLLALLWMNVACAEVFEGTPPEDWADRDVLEWTIFDVNEGDAMMLQCGEERMLVDGGSLAFRKDMWAEMQARNISHVRYILSTHDHDDHIDGLYYMMDYGLTADEYIHAYTEKEMRREDAMRSRRGVRTANKKGIPVRLTFHGDSFMLGNARIEVMRSAAAGNMNNRSLVLRVEYGDSSILLCADIGGTVQRELMAKYPEKIDVDLIKAPHHGITPMVPAFRKAVSPQGYVVTNRRVHAGENMVQVLDSLDEPSFYAGDGVVHAVTDGKDWYMWQDEHKKK